MTPFSSKQAIEFSFSTYRKHVVLLATASALLSASLWVCSQSLERIAHQCGISQAFDSVAIVKKQGHLATGGSIIAQLGTNLKAIPPCYYILLLMVALLGYALFFFLMRGFMNLCLTLKDTGQGSLKLLFSSRYIQLKRFTGGALLYLLSIFGGFVGATFAVVPMTMLGKFLLNNKITVIVSAGACICLMIAVVVWSMGYMFFGFFLLDNPQMGSFKALQMSAALSKGFRTRIVKTLAGTFLVVMGPLLLLLGSVWGIGKMLSVGDSTSSVLLEFISAFITYPLFFLCATYLYRSLNPAKQSAIDKN
jgi:hypothetical protein